MLLADGLSIWREDEEKLKPHPNYTRSSDVIRRVWAVDDADKSEGKIMNYFNMHAYIL